MSVSQSRAVLATGPPASLLSSPARLGHRFRPGVESGRGREARRHVPDRGTTPGHRPAARLTDGKRPPSGLFRHKSGPRHSASQRPPRGHRHRGRTADTSRPRNSRSTVSRDSGSRGPCSRNSRVHKWPGLKPSRDSEFACGPPVEACAPALLDQRTHWVVTRTPHSEQDLLEPSPPARPRAGLRPVRAVAGLRRPATAGERIAVAT